MKTKKRNPLRHDPTRTATLRRKFLAELNSRFRLLKKAIRDLIVVEDAFGLNRLQVQNQRFMFQTTPQKVEAFRRWLKQQMELLVIKEDNDLRNDWWQKYVEEGYRQGAGRAFDDTRKPYAKGYAKEGIVSDFYRGTKEEFLRSSFAQPVAVEKVKLLAGRVFTDLKGISESMSTKLVRKLTEGLVQGKNPKAIARDIDQDIDGIDRSRANTIARTEIIRAHAEGQLDAFENLGVTEVGVAAEWATAEDERVCDLCAPLDGIVMKVEEARGLLPRHPNCRCAWTPANVGEDQAGQKDTKSSIEKALQQSLKEEKTKESSWLGADVTIDKKRPESILK